MADKSQALNIFRAIFPPLTLSAFRLTDQPDLLVKTDSWHFNTATCRNFANRITFFVHFSACSYSH